MADLRQKFASQAAPEVLEALRSIAAEEGRQLQAVIEQALREYVERKRGERPREEVLAHLQASVERHRHLYRRLAE
ncbi:MAG TPA: hypothetical protein VG452_05585 [Egibacteraceae bacterium]|nr:hypothetical protein [Egibacteraceae bacterium]